MNPVGRFLVALASIFAVTVVGTVGYSLLGWDALDALYMTVITVTTVGYREVGPMTRGAEAFTIVLIAMGFGTVFYSFSALIELVVAGQLREALGRRKVYQQIDRLRDHYVVCGLGRMGRIVCRELAANGLPFVIIERDDAALDLAVKTGWLAIQGDATDETTLEQAGLSRARGLVAVLSTDAENLFLILSARAMDADLCIVARAEDERTEQKILRAGATRVVAPYLLGGARIAQALLRPSVVDFIEIATQRQRMDLLMEEAPIAPDSKLCEKEIRGSGIRSQLGLIIVAVKRAGGDMVFNPPADLRLQSGDVLLALGKRPALERLRAIAAPTGHRKSAPAPG